jgi:hypothetical protein
VSTEYAKKLAALATTAHITHCSVGTMIYFGLVANGYYKDKAIRFRVELEQEYPATAAACMLLETLDNSMIPGSVAGAATCCAHSPTPPAAYPLRTLVSPTGT